MTFDIFLQLFIGGLSVGTLYALPALGISLIWNAAGVFNFANGEFVMLSSFIIYSLYMILELPFAIAILITIIIMFIFGALIEKLIVGTLQRQNAPSIKSLISFIALSIFLRNAARFIWGTTPRTIKNPFGSKPFELFFDVFIMPHTIWIFSISVAVMLALLVLFKMTKIGLAMRATTQNRTVASLMGINTSRIVTIVFGLSSVVAAVSGALCGAVFYTTLDMGIMFGTKAFASNIIGGFGNPIGAIIGGLILGVVETLSASFISSQYKDIITFSLLLFFLMFKPKGLFKLDVVEKV